LHNKKNIIRVAIAGLLLSLVPAWYTTTLPPLASGTLLLIGCCAALYLWNAIGKPANAEAAENPELQHLRDQTDALRQQLHDTQQIKERFLANMSHEIRTPMNGVFGMTDLLGETSLSDRQRRYVTTMRQSLETLLNITNDILDFSKIQEGSIRLENSQFSLNSMIEDVCELHAETAQKKGLELVCDITAIGNTYVSADQPRLRQILSNLVSNAVKFTDHGEVKVTVETAGTDAFKFSVYDTGIGIAENQKEQIFREFFQGDNSSTRRFGGTGLGLTISYNLVNLFGGELQLQSNAGQGSVFSFVCELARTDTPDDEDSGVLESVRVLVVDDNATNSEILLHQLQQWDIQVAVADSGSAALTLLDNCTENDARFDLAILDFHMPGMDGFELARHIQNHPVYSSLKLMMLTSSLTNVDDKELDAMGISCSLTKPARQAALYNALVDIVRGTGSENQSSPQESEPRQRPQVLLTEDNPINQEVASMMLENIGCEVQIAENGADALEALEERIFDLVLMDCQMPVMDGYEATRVIRNKSKQSSIPVIALTANAMEGDRELCLSSGMDDYLSKPVSQKNLQKKIDKWLHSRKDNGQNNENEKQPAEVKLAMNLDLDESALDTIRQLQRPGKPDILGKIVNMYLDKTPTLIADIESGIAANDSSKVKMAAHTLKSSSAYLGATGLADLCNKLEAKAANDDLEDASADPILQGFEVVSEQIKRLA
jgi:signal transduction histidine kinase/CheY-like chemotaxis protein/HPt (histidine-containing phosphotransfer) domain-containing protein